jgi:hypothetical protein
VLGAVGPGLADPLGRVVVTGGRDDEPLGVGRGDAAGGAVVEGVVVEIVATELGDPLRHADSAMATAVTTATSGTAGRAPVRRGRRVRRRSPAPPDRWLASISSPPRATIVERSTTRMKVTTRSQL